MLSFQLVKFNSLKNNLKKSSKKFFTLRFFAYISRVLIIKQNKMTNSTNTMPKMKQVSQLTWTKLKGMYKYDLGNEGAFLENMLMHEDPKGWDFDKLYYFAKSITNTDDVEVLSKWIATEFYQTDFAWTCNYLGYKGFIQESKANGTFSQCYPNG